MSSIETVTSICKKALLKVGAPTISSLDETSKSARACSEFYEYTRDKVLQDHPWGFAKVRATLQEDAETPEYEFDHQFVKPADCLKVLEVVDSTDYPVEYAVEGNYILTNDSPIKIKYISRIESPALFSQGFIDCLIIALAANIAYTLTGSNTMAQELMAEYMREKPNAKKKNGQEGSIKAYISTNWTNNRRI
jgi:hypothetical protein